MRKMHDPTNFSFRIGNFGSILFHYNEDYKEYIPFCKINDISFLSMQ